MHTLTDPDTAALDLDALNARFDDAEPEALIAWAGRSFGEGLMMTSSFGAQSALMLHLVTRIIPDIPVIFIDTGYLFPETYRFAEQLRQRLELNLKVYQPRISAAYFEAIHGRLWEAGPEGQDAYLQARKVEPMQRALRELGARAWIAGLRASQTDYRAGLRKIERQDNRYKIHPVLDWSGKAVHDYLTRHALPLHPLVEKGYLSIGDVHSTAPVTEAHDDSERAQRAARFSGLRQECGLHVPATEAENQSRQSSSL